MATASMNTEAEAAKPVAVQVVKEVVIKEVIKPAEVVNPPEIDYEQELAKLRQQYEEKIDGLNGMLQMHKEIKSELESKLEQQKILASNAKTVRFGDESETDWQKRYE